MPFCPWHVQLKLPWHEFWQCKAFWVPVCIVIPLGLLFIARDEPNNLPYKEAEDSEKTWVQSFGRDSILDFLLPTPHLFTWYYPQCTPLCLPYLLFLSVCKYYLQCHYSHQDILLLPSTLYDLEEEKTGGPPVHTTRFTKIGELFF